MRLVKIAAAAFMACVYLVPGARAADGAADGSPVQAPQAPGAEERLNVIGAAPKTIAPTNMRVNPIIPPGVQVNAQEGWVRLKVLLSPSGGVTAATIAESYPKGLFDKQVLDVIHGWQFKPPFSDDAYDVTVAFYLTQFRVKRGHGYGYSMDQQLLDQGRNNTPWRGVRAYYFQHFERLGRALDKGDLEEAGKRVKLLKDDHQAGKLHITEIARTYIMLARYLRMTGHCDLALNEARRALLLARYMDNSRMVFGTHMEVMSCLLTLGRNDDAVDYYDSWRTANRTKMSMSTEAVAHMEDLRTKGFGTGRTFSIIDFYDSNFKQAENPDSTLQVVVEVLSIAFPAPPDAPSLLD